MAAIGLAGLGGWWLGHTSKQIEAAETPQTAFKQRRAPLEAKLKGGTASDAEQLQLLKLRLALGDKSAALGLLETLSDQRPENWQLRLISFSCSQ